MDNTSFFTQDASLYAQYWGTFAKTGDIEPEKRLFAAVLDDAVKNYRKLVITRGRRFVEEETWLFSDDKNATFSFCNVCEVLGLNPDRVRRSLRKPPAPDLPSLPAAELPRVAHRAPYRRARAVLRA
ncbi:MAG TPA: hypothetical protein VGH50_05270 [Candidatus Binatia bacterium]|jgi:hypothetical protein